MIPEVTEFAGLGLAEPLLRAIADAGYTTPTPIQAKAIPVVLTGRDLLAAAQTGTGETAGFTLPILQRLLSKPLAARATSRTTSASTRFLGPRAKSRFFGSRSNNSGVTALDWR